MNGIVYAIRNIITNERYIGYTQNPKQRKEAHMISLRTGKHPNEKLRNNCKIYGYESFVFEILETNVSIEQSPERENHWINFHNSYENGFNRRKACFGNNKYAPKALSSFAKTSLRKKRKAMGLSQAGFAKLLKISQNSVWEAENGYPIPYPSLQRIHAYFGVPIE